MSPPRSASFSRTHPASFRASPCRSTAPIGRVFRALLDRASRALMMRAWRPALRQDLKHLLAPPFRGALAGKGKAAGVDAEIDQCLGDLDGAAKALEHGHVPADLVELLLQQRLQPVGRGTADHDRVGAVLLDGGDRFL